LTAEDFAFQSNRILLIDIAIPRDIEMSVAENENVVLKNIDDLHSIVDRNFERRMRDLPQVKKLLCRKWAIF
jgi:glutamyl-tRNA reductase